MTFKMGKVKLVFFSTKKGVFYDSMSEIHCEVQVLSQVYFYKGTNITITCLDLFLQLILKFLFYLGFTSCDLQ